MKKIIFIFAIAFLTSSCATSQTSQPTIKNCAKLEYPSTARGLNQEGSTVILFEISEIGKLISSSVSSSSGSEILDSAALKNLETCSFNPQIENGTPQKTTTRLKYTWKLNDTIPDNSEADEKQRKWLASPEYKKEQAEKSKLRELNEAVKQKCGRLIRDRWERTGTDKYGRAIQNNFIGWVPNGPFGPSKYGANKFWVFNLVLDKGMDRIEFGVDCVFDSSGRVLGLEIRRD